MEECFLIWLRKPLSVNKVSQNIRKIDFWPILISLILTSGFSCSEVRCNKLALADNFIGLERGALGFAILLPLRQASSSLLLIVCLCCT
jgi:hypothetical protein